MKKSTLLAAVALVPLSFGMVHAQEAQVEDPVQEEMPADTPPAMEQPEADAPEMEAPADGNPMPEDPMAEEPMADEPMADDAATDEPPAGEAVTDEAPADEAATDEAAEPANTEVLLQQQGQSELRGDWIIGASVQSPEDETVGSIVDVVIDPEQGDVTAAILSVGGFLGIGAKDIAVNWEQLQIDYDGQDIRIDLTRAEADAAPEYQFRERQDPPPPPMATDGMATEPSMGVSP